MVLGVSWHFLFEFKVLPGIARDVDSDGQDVEVSRDRFIGQGVDLGTVEMKQVVDLNSSAPLATLAQCELHPANKALLKVPEHDANQDDGGKPWDYYEMART
jgi:hypothetical protein